MKRSYAVVFERGTNNYSAYCPDVLGCVATGADWEEIKTMIRDALGFHIEMMVDDGDTVPQAMMGVSDAMHYHSDVEVEEWEAEVEIETTVAMIEVDVPAVEPADVGVVD